MSKDLRPVELFQVIAAAKRGHPVHSWKGNEQRPDRVIAAYDGRSVDCWGCAAIIALVDLANEVPT